MWLCCNGRWVCLVNRDLVPQTWLFCHGNGLRGITDVTWNVRDRRIRGVVSAPERHGEQILAWFPTDSTDLKSLRSTSDRNLRPETKFDNYSVHNWERKDASAAKDIENQLGRIVISRLAQNLTERKSQRRVKVNEPPDLLSTETLCLKGLS